MTRPFRLQRPSLPVRLIERPHLLATLDRRRSSRLVTLVAGPGFGKTVMLTAAIEAAAADPAVRDVWISCEPGDEDAGRLESAIASALGLAADARIDDVVDAVWAMAPQQVCFVLDDVHEVPADSDGASWLGRLLDELPHNGHVVMASRAAVPVRTARLAASGQLVRVVEADLVLDEHELASFARASGVEASLLASTGGWPALAELTVNAGADLVVEYLWEEVITRLGGERATLLARFAAVRGGDDAVVSELAGRATTVDDLVAQLPLVKRAAGGWAELHPLWTPALRRLLSSDELAATRELAAEVHRRAGRYGIAADLHADAEAWDPLVDAIRDVVVGGHDVAPSELGRWQRMLPRPWQERPEAIVAAAIEIHGRSPVESVSRFAAAASAFRDRQDVDGELAAMEREGLVRWWLNDFGGLLAIHLRSVELAAAGSRRAAAVAAVGHAAMAHLGADSAGVLAALADVGDEAAGWLPQVHWLRSVAHRREGDLRRARDELVMAVEHGASPSPQLEIAHLRIDWLEGRIDHVGARLGELAAHYAHTDDRFLAKEAALEAACRAAWTGSVDEAARHLADVDGVLDELPGPLARVLRLIATAASAVAEGDEASAAAVLDESADLWEGPAAWFWRDRGAAALLHVLAPRSRDSAAVRDGGPAHRSGRELAAALVAARDGDLRGVRGLTWPAAGVVRAHLPMPWAVELAIAGRAVGNQPPEGVFDPSHREVRPAIRAVVHHSSSAVAGRARAILAELPAVPPYQLSIGVIGPLEVRRDDILVTGPDVRRARVRELLGLMVARRQVRREAAAAELWPDLADGGHNLRVTLSYLQGVLQPERSGRELPYFLRSDGPWLVLADDVGLRVDLWDLESRLDAAERAERSGSPSAALAAYREAVPLWRGEPFAELVEAAWADSARAHIRRRYVQAAMRAGELLLANGAWSEASLVAEHAIGADDTTEQAYSLLVRAHAGAGDRPAASAVLDRYRRALAALDLHPTAATVALLTPSGAQVERR